jgi:hypoxanthine phosphoribosyltransferase
MSRNIIHKVQSEIFKRTNLFTFLNQNDVVNLVDSLVEKITQNYQPDLLIGVSSGGDFPTEMLSERLNVDYVKMNISHYSLSVLGVELDEIVGVYRLIKTFGYKHETLLKQDVNSEEIKNKKALIIDDDSYSGKTLQIAMESILEKKPLQLKTAVLHTYNQNDLVNFSGKTYSKEDYYHQKLRFPWSKISPYFTQDKLF